MNKNTRKPERRHKEKERFFESLEKSKVAKQENRKKETKNNSFLRGISLRISHSLPVMALKTSAEMLKRDFKKALAVHSMEEPHQGDFKKGNPIIPFVVLQLFAAACVGLSGCISDNSGRIATGGANILGRIKWLSDHLKISKSDKSKLKKEIQRSCANKVGTAFAVAAHVPQFISGITATVSPLSNGDTLGATAAMLGFGGMAVNSAIEENRLTKLRATIKKLKHPNKQKALNGEEKKLLTDFILSSKDKETLDRRVHSLTMVIQKKKRFKYNEADLQQLIGYAARGEVWREIFLKVITPLFLAAKAVSYGAEGIHEINDGNIFGGSLMLTAGVLFGGSASMEIQEENSERLSKISCKFNSLRDKCRGKSKYIPAFTEGKHTIKDKSGKWRTVHTTELFIPKVVSIEKTRNTIHIERNDLAA